MNVRRTEYSKENEWKGNEQKRKSREKEKKDNNKYTPEIIVPLPYGIPVPIYFR